MREDLAADRTLRPEHREPAAIEQLLRSREFRYVTYADWLRVDKLEVANGVAQGRPRVKFAGHSELLDAALGDR